MGCQLSVDQRIEKDLEEGMIMRIKVALEQLPAEATVGFKKQLQGLIDREASVDETTRVAAALFAEILEVLFQRTVQQILEVLGQLPPERSDQCKDRLAKIKEAPRATPDTMAAAGAAAAELLCELYTGILRQTINQIKPILAELPSQAFDEQLQQVANVAATDVITATVTAVDLLKTLQEGHVDRQIQQIAKFVAEYPPVAGEPFQKRLAGIEAALGSEDRAAVAELLADICVDLFGRIMKGIKETLPHVGPDQARSLQSWIDRTEADPTVATVPSVVSGNALFKRIQVHLMNGKVANITSLLGKLPEPQANLFTDELRDIPKRIPMETSHGRTLAGQAASALLQRVRDAVDRNPAAADIEATERLEVAEMEAAQATLNGRLQQQEAHEIDDYAGVLAAERE